MKVCGYCRVSTDIQAETGYGIETQRAAILDYCSKQGHELLDIFIDEGISGTTTDRLGLTTMLGSLTKIDNVVVLNTSRLWREATIGALITREFKKHNVDVISIEQPTYSINSKDPSNILINGIMNLLDQYEHMTINIKLAKGRLTKVRSGIKGSGVAPLGYKWSHVSLPEFPAPKSFKLKYT